jgi:hypothetical protein
MGQWQDLEACHIPPGINTIPLMWFTLPLDVIWKHHMGERHWTFLRLMVHTFVIKWAVFLLMLLAFPDDLVPLTDQRGYKQFAVLCGFILLMWIFGLANLWEIRKRRKAGIQWHTHYWGKPRFLPDKAIVHCLIIPIGSALMAYGFYRLFPPLGIYLFIMAAIQFIATTDSYRNERIEKLNRADREIQMSIKADELEFTQRGPLDIIRVPPAPKRVRHHEHEAMFVARWSNVLKSSDSPKTLSHN